MDEKKSKLVYAKRLSAFILLFAAIIALGVWIAQRDAQREAEQQYEFNIIVATTLLTVCVLALAKLNERRTVGVQIVILNKNIAQSNFWHFIDRGLTYRNG